MEVLVPETERDEYAQKIPNPLLTVPDSIEGLGRLRNWVLDNFDEETIVMVDDDITHFYALTGPKTRDIKDPDEVMQVIINTAVMAKDAGCNCFGFAQTDIRKYSATEPFKLNSWVGCIIGVIGRKYRFRDDKFKVDIDFCLKNLLGTRILWQDARYYAAQNRDNNLGGNAKFRTKEGFEQSLYSLQKRWGTSIKVRDHKGQVNIKLNVARRQTIKYE